MSQAKKSNLSSIISFLMFIASVAIWYFLILPQFGKFKEASNQGAILGAKVEALTKNNTTLELLKNQLTSTLNDQNKLDIAIPKETQIPEIFITVESLAQKTEVDVISIKPENEAVDNLIKTVIVVEAEYPNLKNFMLGLTKNIRPTVTESFKVIKKEAEVSTSTSTSDATISAETNKIETSGRSLQSEIVVYFATAQKNTEKKSSSVETSNSNKVTTNNEELHNAE
ncbi:hypothetical protein COZ61_02040 [Candidatus Berkelbacteria bacterium CG_4_8_14_3_um_filter_33_6]|uniref:Pilus assembly protein PilO n=1 Tax=Candidatus Berkelbacteria bacterium CG_4_10_14_0_2_um_filter_35_9_33_12 TaxID=1974499 RepID=A0A2M7W474_9BACT|nr:MAG: hypothetical protein COX10_00510 [Candidatus Berkelbacteria bacterium CG23_combo_of_CG06-09_8_20_14_all_33_15]PIS08335.1 MAG: hypothetical protein COT76_01955 [Candidatus Berkelbacteria bacterium CG10_big_fil_rev_8_21_14_0_10_33_10]PIX31011.1 MAG: hypothetical protein COZ61_02040 [Candidatus Berkelbacteria bacterium CG_4_8_14_3_um_filter_33_6]PIZ28193.1 MAG: hypothetical protein COY43_01800 [Candidatus Berkelbacteria bacterium CG_4_10_14_0_8_um_filter_35_9_33_8]PJA20443.1 MAG: hypotheti